MNEDIELYVTGNLTLRDYFAQQAMSLQWHYSETRLDESAELAYKMADAMLKARETK